MRAFFIKAGTEVKLFETKLDAESDPIEHVAKKDHLFFREDMVVDVLGRFNGSPVVDSRVAEDWASVGYYGFLWSCELGDYIVLCKSRDIQMDCS